MKILYFIFTVSVCFAGAAFAQAIDFDGDGYADSYGSGGNVPMPTGIERVDTGSSGSSSSRSSSGATSTRSSSHKVSHSSGPSMNTVVGTAVAGALMEAVFSDLFSSPQPPPGPTPEQIEAQRRLEEQQRLEFQRSNRQLKGRLKGGTTYVEDKNISEAGGLKLKTIPATTALTPQMAAAKSSGDVHSNFFGESNAKPTVELLREPVTGAGTNGGGLIDPSAYKQAVSRIDLTQEERERLFLRTKVKPVQLDDHPMIDARALVEKERWTDPYIDVAVAAGKGGAKAVSVSLVEEGGKRLLKTKSGSFKDIGYDEAVAGGKAAFVERPENPAEAVIAAGDYVISKKAPTWQLIAADGAANSIGAGTRQAIVRYWASKDSQQYYDPTPVATAKEKWNSWVAERNDCSRALLNRIGAGEFKK